MSVDRLRSVAGLDLFGVCTADPFPDVEAELRRRVESGLSGRLAFTFGDPARATDVRRSFPWARRLVVGGVSYLPQAGSPGPGGPGRARIARFAVDDAYEPLRRALGRVADVLRQEGRRAELLVDDTRLVDRAAAVRAGLGWWGKSSMVLTHRFGPWTLFGSVVTDAELPVSEPDRRSCGTCDACMPACPTGAIVAPGVVDARLCLAALLQGRGDIPADVRPAVGDRLYGCDECLAACPPGRRLAGEAQAPRGRVDAAALLTLDDREILDRFGRFYLPGRRPEYLRRNALVVLGNGGDAGHAPLVGRFLSHPSPLLRRHAAWALGRIGGEEAERLLSERLPDEPDPPTREELAEALTALRRTRADRRRERRTP